ncbi:hypothetical protein AX774_g4017 [Zancudomyces culisetae]|uniref:Uncharacterized protein n=1 Tax=Zancudomyces culisetae TaxID=1213189 RepID=A0A1R1PNG0_ZANCU|nr:hypothetical protein AX774_g4017 [Zancudomyces culisetae]|eukprot:OMH82490.1 hypothetical protein AX774_g4017 [Zancudomyces culisetae]
MLKKMLTFVVLLKLCFACSDGQKDIQPGIRVLNVYPPTQHIYWRDLSGPIPMNAGNWFKYWSFSNKDFDRVQIKYSGHDLPNSVISRHIGFDVNSKLRTGQAICTWVKAGVSVKVLARTYMKCIELETVPACGCHSKRLRTKICVDEKWDALAFDRFCHTPNCGLTWDGPFSKEKSVFC